MIVSEVMSVVVKREFSVSEVKVVAVRRVKWIRRKGCAVDSLMALATLTITQTCVIFHTGQ